MALASADVSWDHQLTDGTGDVRNVLTNANATDMDGLDIVACSVSEQGPDLNVTMALAGSFDPAATYNVEVVCDGDEDSTFSFTCMEGTFSVGGPGLSDDGPEAYVSADGTLLSWVVGKASIPASERTEVTFAESFRLVGITPFSDTLPDGGGGGGNGGGDPGDPVHMLVRTEMVSVEHVRSTVQVVVAEDEARSLRAEFDTDGDRTVTREEYDQHVGFLALTLSSWNRTDLTLDGEAPEHRVMTVDFEGVVGRTDSSSPVSQVVTLDIVFPKATGSGEHTYTGDLAAGRDAGEMWHVTPDSSYTLVLPRGWTFDGTWSGDNVDYVDDDGRRFAMTGSEMRANWNTTIGQTTSLTITESGDVGSGDGDSPGFGVLVAGVAIIGAMAVAAAFRRG
jgi:hypothetical protein